MEVIPAIDLRGGRCVRLYQGDYDRETVFSDDPMEVARRWVDQGARRLHVIDLDGAKSGEQPNAEAAYRIAGEAGVPVQLGGGIRSVESARQAIERGIDRVLLGTAAVEEPDRPTVILARTIKGYGLGEAGEGRNITHQQKKLNEEELREFRSRFGIPISDEDVEIAVAIEIAKRNPNGLVSSAFGSNAEIEVTFGATLGTALVD